MSDRRSVSTDALETLGTIIDENAGRDAIHVAVEPVRAGEKLFPGQDVGLVNGVAHANVICVGIVDPFLKSAVLEGEWFWMLLYPRTITSLRHVWAHPAFDQPNETISRTDHVAKSEAWIADHAELLGLGKAKLMAYAAEWLNGEEYQVQQGSEWWRDNFDATEFWHHYEVVTGTTVAADKKHSFFCCTC